MTFDEAMREAARAAENAVKMTLKKYTFGGIRDEPEITAYLVSQLDSQFDKPIGGVNWSSTIVRNGSGNAAEEKKIGADLLLHVSLNTTIKKYSKGALIQSNRAEPDEAISTNELTKLQTQCAKMSGYTPGSFVFCYGQKSMRTGSASIFELSSDKFIHYSCPWTSYRFFRELFRCPIGDRRINSARVDDLPIPYVLAVKGSGDRFDDDHVL